jgi:two-component system response regulator NreC
VLVLVAEGHSASGIGERLGLSPKTVETYKQRVCDKLGLRHRSEYVRFCLGLDLLHAHL